MDLSIIIVSWNVRDLLEKCLKSVFEQTRNISFGVFVVDNASTDGTSEMVLEKFPQINLIRNSRNLGFAAANNMAIRQILGQVDVILSMSKPDVTLRQAQGDSASHSSTLKAPEFILLLNPDVEILDGAIEKMVDFMRAHPEAGIAGPKLLNPDKTLQASVRRFPTLLDQILILAKIPHLWPNLGPLKRYYARDFDYSLVSEVDQVMGAFFIVRREVFEHIGLLDENFYLWFEEVDFCRRAKEAGYKVMYNPEAEVIHYGGQSFRQQSIWIKQWKLLKSMVWYFWKQYKNR